MLRSRKERSSFGGGDRQRIGASREHIVEQAISAGTRPAPSGADTMGLKIGDDVRHAQWGEGVIVDIEGSGDKAEASVHFPTVGEKRLLLDVPRWAAEARKSARERAAFEALCLALFGALFVSTRAAWERRGAQAALGAALLVLTAATMGASSAERAKPAAARKRTQRPTKKNPQSRGRC